VPGYAAFLRGVNLGRVRKVSSAELRRIFEGEGFGGVSTFRTSGNVVFASDDERIDALKKRIEGKLAEALGYEVDVFLRTATQVRAIAAYEPFPADEVEASHGKLQVSILSSAPNKRSRSQALALATDEDRLAFGDRELYWLPSGGMRDSALNAGAIEKILGRMTMRTKGTVELLAAKFFAE
jgi:uncharacterized protein (DUF1697 family)